MSDQERKILKDFFDEVCLRAENNMMKTGKLEGSHYAAMIAVLKEKGVLNNVDGK